MLLWYISAILFLEFIVKGNFFKFFAADAAWVFAAAVRAFKQVERQDTAARCEMSVPGNGSRRPR